MSADDIRAFLFDCISEILPDNGGLINYDENLFAVGLDSLQLTVLELQIMKRYSYLDIPLGFCYSNFTPNRIINYLLELQQHQPKRVIYETDRQALQNTETARFVSLSHAQRRCLFASYDNKGLELTERFIVNFMPSKEFNCQTATIYQRLTQALNAVIMTNSVLRSSCRLYSNDNNGTIAETIIHSGTEAYFVLSPTHGVSTTDKVQNEDVSIFTTTETDIPLRFGCFLENANSSNKFRLFAIFHNIITDGKSIQLFVEQFFWAFCNVENYVKHFFTVQYCGFVDYEQEMLNSAEFQSHRNVSMRYWLNKLTGINEQSYLASRQLSLYYDDKRADKIEEKIIECLYCERGRVEYAIGRHGDPNADVAAAIQRLAVACDSTPFAVVISIFRLLLYKLFGYDDIVLGMPVDNRHIYIPGGMKRPDFSNGIGPYLNVCLLRCAVHADTTIADFIKANTDDIQSSIRYGQIPFDKVLGEIRKHETKKEINEKDLFQVAVIQEVQLLERFSDSSDDYRISVEPLTRNGVNCRPQYPMMWHFVIDSQHSQLRMRVDYDSEQFSEAMLQTMVERYAVLCDMILKLIGTHGWAATTLRKTSLFAKSDVECHKRLIEKQLQTMPYLTVKTSYEHQMWKKRGRLSSRSMNSHFKHPIFKFSALHRQNFLTPVRCRLRQNEKLPSPISWLLAALNHCPPNKTLVEDSNSCRLSAAELLNLSSELAHIIEQKVFEYIGQSAMSTDRIIAVLHKRNTDLVLLILGIWLAGCIVLPISNDWPIEKIRNAISGISAEVLLITDRDSTEKGSKIWFSQITAKSLINEAYRRYKNSSAREMSSTISKFSKTAAVRSSFPKPAMIGVAGRKPEFSTKSVYGTFDVEKQELSSLSKEGRSRALADSRIISRRTEALNRLSKLKTKNLNPKNNRIVKQFKRHYSAHDLLYVTFSSGSTGMPKAIATEGLGLSQLILNYTTTFHYDAHSVIYQVVNYAFDIFFADLLVALTNGARLLLASDAVPCLDELTRCTHAYIMPAYLSHLTNADSLCCLAGLQAVLFGGEPISEEWLTRAITTGVRLFQLFGFTEASVYSTYQYFSAANISKKLTFYEINKDAKLKVYLSSQKDKIGRPFRGVYTFVIDSDGQPLPTNAVGAEGFLCVGGPTVARGYIGSIDSNIFTYDKTLRIRYFKTNDRVLIDTDGELRFLGRADQFVKIRGHLVNLPQLEQLYTRLMPMTRQCVVRIIEEKLILFLTIKKKETNEDNLKMLLIERLEAAHPPHLIPHQLVVLSSFELNSNGKIDRQILDSLILCQKDVSPQITTELDNDVVNPVNTLITKTCQIFADNIGVTRIEPIENIFERGADSLKILLACQELKNKLGIRLSIDDIFKQKTVAKMIDLVNLQKSTVDIEQQSYTNNMEQINYDFLNIPLSFNQEHIWFLDRLNETADDSYHIPLVFRFNRTPDMTRLSYAINRLIQNNAVLRTVVTTETVEEDNGELFLRQVLLSGTESFLSLRCLDLAKAVKSVFNLSSDIPIKVTEAKWNDDAVSSRKFMFRVVLHHIAVDGWSLAESCQQLQDLYRYKSSGQLNTQNVASSYARFSVDQRARNYDTELAFWRNELNNVKNHYIPIDGSNVFSARTVTSTNHKPEFDYDSKRKDTTSLMNNFEFQILVNSTKLGRFLSSKSCTRMQLFLAAYALAYEKEVLSRTTDVNIHYDNLKKHVVVGVAFANRDTPTRHVVGYFANVHAVRLDYEKELGVGDYVEHTRRQLSRAADHANVPFELVVRALNPKRQPARNPIFQTTFAYENDEFFGYEERTEKNNIYGRLKFSNELYADVEEIELVSAKFDQSWRIFDTRSDKFDGYTRFRGVIEYSSSKFRQEFVANAAKSLQDAIEFLISASTESRLAEFFTSSIAVHEQNACFVPAIIIEDQIDTAIESVNTTVSLEQIQRVIVAVWTDILGLDERTLHGDDNFFDLGGHSLLANRICARLRKQLGVRCELVALFEV